MVFKRSNVEEFKGKCVTKVICDPDSVEPKCELRFEDGSGLGLDFGADFPAINIFKKGESFLEEEIKMKIAELKEQIKNLMGQLK